MNINNIAHTAIWYEEGKILYIDQTKLPWELRIRELQSLDDAVRAINNMEVRGAPLIGVTAAFGMWLAYGEGVDPGEAAKMLTSTRPTAINLQWSVDKMIEGIDSVNTLKDKQNLTGSSHVLKAALEIRSSEIAGCRSIGEYGLPLIEEIAGRKNGEPVNILTHCNAGWLACVEWGTATAPIYMAHDKGILVHVWVDETRPRNQGAKLTTYELGAHGVPYTLITDNTGGHLMQNGMVDMVIVGTDRVAANGDVANKIGTYLKALAAKDNNVPFYVAMPYSSYDPDTPSGGNIPIEERSGEEVRMVDGCQMSDVSNQSSVINISIVPDNTPVANYGFDNTPARLISGYITENGIKTIL